MKKISIGIMTLLLVCSLQLMFTPQTALAADTVTGQDVADFATQFIGNPYRYGGSSLTNGTDCSGFVMSVYANFGISLPHYSQSMKYEGTVVSSLAEAQPGDVLVYSGHTGIYLGGGKMISALGRRYGICVSSATYKPIRAIRRMI